MPREPAPIERYSGESGGVVRGRTHEIVDKQCVAGNAQSFARKAFDLFWLEMMEEQRTTDQVKAFVAEGKRECVTAHGCSGRRAQVARRAVEYHCLDRDGSEPLLGILQAVRRCA